MAFDTTIILNIAENLFQTVTATEEYYRSSTNRAYYSAYHECCRVAVSFNYKSTQMPKYNNFKHAELCRLLINHNKTRIIKSAQDKNVIKLGYLLKQTKDLRCKADYKDNKTFTRNQAKDSLLLAENILQIAKQV